MPRRSLWWLFAGIVVSLACYERADRNPYGRWFAEVIDTINRHYVEPVDDEALFEAAVGGMVGTLDDYSAFLPRSESREFQEAIDQHYGGVGIDVVIAGPERVLTVVSPLPDTPAYKAGVRAGDQIVAIDGKRTRDLVLPDAVRLLRGEPGSQVTIGVRREGTEEELSFRLTRAVIKTDSVLGDLRGPDGRWSFLLPGDEKIGYLRVVSFGESTYDEFVAAMQWLTRHDCRGLILDLRNNPGGLLESAREICELFEPKDAVIVSTRGRGGRERARYLADGDGPFQALPLVVLVNRHSASASEIVAASLQDNGRATVVGERTWGKGTVQNILPMEGGRSSLKLTVGTYWRPSGQNIHRMRSSQETDEWGVTPDEGCQVLLDEAQLADWTDKRRRRDAMPSPGSRVATAGVAEPPKSSLEFDPQLERAVEALKATIDRTRMNHDDTTDTK